MIKVEVHKNLLYEKTQITRQPVSLKKNLICFPSESQESPRVSTASFISRAIKSPSKNISERLKIKSQRQRYIQNYEQVAQNQSPLFSRKSSKNPESSMQRSNSTKISPTNFFRNTTYTSNTNIRKAKTIKSARTSEEQICLKSCQESKQFYSKKLSQSQISNKIHLMKNSKYDLNNFMINPSKNELIVCKSLKKHSQMDFFDSQISKLISKKVGGQTNEQHDISDETCFNVVLNKIKQKIQSQASDSDFQAKKQKYFNKVKDSAKIYENPQTQVAITTPSETNQKVPNIFKSSENRKKSGFKEALQWSNKRLQLMKSPFIKSMKSKKLMLGKEKAKKQEYQIEGWIK